MKKLLTVVVIIAAVVTAALYVLQRLPAPAEIREDFDCE